jgi:predicted AlkP superfamily pyrophosphatase or phosphodiesterase
MRRFLRLLAILVVLVASSALALSTGQPPRGAGSPHVVIISLDGFAGWALDDPSLPVPTLRRLAAAGASAKGMIPVNPTVTWPNHTSMVTGVTPSKHGVLFNGLLIRKPDVPPVVEPWRDKHELVRVKTLYDAVHERGMTTAQVDWVAIQHAPTITWEFAERPDPNGQVAGELVTAGVITREQLETFAARNIVFRDHMWTQAAAHILRRHRPNLLLFHLLNLDSTQHRYAPRTHAATTTMALLDAQVATIVRTLEETGLAPDTTLFVVSDHGFKAVKRQIRPNAALRHAGVLQVEEGKVTRSQAYAVPEGGTALVYLTAPDPQGETLVRIKKALQDIEGIGGILEPAEFERYGLPLPSDTRQMGMLLLTAKDGYAFTGQASDPVVLDAPAGSLGAHGYLATDPDLRALFIASGRGIRAGVALDAVNTIDLAPTAARLLGVDLPNVDGSVLTEILADGR